MEVIILLRRSFIKYLHKQEKTSTVLFVYQIPPYINFHGVCALLSLFDFEDSDPRFFIISTSRLLWGRRSLVAFSHSLHAFTAFGRVFLIF